MLIIAITITIAVAIGTVAPAVRAVFDLWQAVPRRNADMVLF
jgi:hypothetical protein